VTPLWNNIYPWIKAAVTDLASLSILLQRAVGRIASTFKAECLLVMGLELAAQDEVLICGTETAWKAIAQHIPLSDMDPVPGSGDSPDAPPDAPVVRRLPGRNLPDWLNLPASYAPTQTTEGVLTLPIVTQGQSEQGTLMVRSLQGMMKLWRSPNRAATSPVPPNSSWKATEIEALQVISTQLGLAYSTIYWQQRLEHARQQAALVGRISRLLNSSLNPTKIVSNITAELGQGMESDRCILVNLHHSPAAVVAAWHNPDLNLPPVEPEPVDQAQWQAVTEQFQQSGASYLLVTPESEQEDVGYLIDWMDEMKMVSGLFMPLFLQEEFFGAIALLSGQLRYYQVEELQTVRQVADQIAIALANIQHYQNLWLRQEDLRQQTTAPFRETLKDQLTQLPNQVALERELNQLSARTVWTVQAPFSIIIADLDYFKLVNDTYGYMVGDEVLRVVALRLRRQVRRNTPIYRYSGEEFVIILPEASQKAAMDVSERLRYATGAFPIATSAGEISVTASFGVTQQRPAQDNSAWDVLHRAEENVNQAKRLGRDRIYSG
jgi:diguanylate cyclase (GGDEF)-like protein